jgi:hypothetical protein
MAAVKCQEVCTRLVFEAFLESDESSIYTKLQFVIETYSEIEMLTSLAQCNEEGETPLVVAMKRKNFALIDHLKVFLFKCFSRAQEEYVLMCEAAIDQLSHQIPIVEFTELFISYSSYPCNGRVKWLEFVVQTLFRYTLLHRQEKIVALELIGAALIIEFLKMKSTRVPDEARPLLGLDCWRKAMTLRYFPADGDPLLPKTPYVGVPSDSSSIVFGSVVEVMSMEGLDLLQQDFERNAFSIHRGVQFSFQKRMKLQALQVIRRICHGHLSWLYIRSLSEFGFNMNCEGVVLDCKLLINTYLLIMEQATGHDPKMLSPKLFDVFIETLGFMSFVFHQMPCISTDNRREEDFTLLSYDNLLATTQFISTIAKYFPKSSMLSSIQFQNFYLRPFDLGELVWRLLCILELISPRLTDKEKQKLEEYFSIYIKTLFPERTTTVLHAAAQVMSKGYLFLFNLTNLHHPVQLILKLGGDPNAIDKNGRTPLHFLTGNFLEEDVPIFKALLKAGGHLDMAADSGETYISILKENLKRYVAHPYFVSLINTVYPLSCYCARVIRRHGIRFDEDRLPIHLQELVARHSNAKGKHEMNIIIGFACEINYFLFL